MPTDVLSPETCAVLRRAAETPLSYGVRLYACPGDGERVLVSLGEAHVKLDAAWTLGKEVISHFELRGVETFQTRQVFAGRALAYLIHAPRVVLRALTFGLVKGSTITDAKELSTGDTVELERTTKVPFGLHVASVYLAAFFVVAGAHFLLAILSSLPASPAFVDVAMSWVVLAVLLFEAHGLMIIPALIFRRHPWSWLLHPGVGILTLRDTLMADGTVRMLADFPTPCSAIVIMGRAHLAGYERELVEKHGFRRIELPA